ncbi:hypothetical protein FLCH110379_01435 [Flavobacterium chungbukense]|uniref:Uncharacterized protein n=1 Tax=Flavobacterium chungbukense TaxID=877464 RepID=A0ABP7YGU4_9FLAO
MTNFRKISTENLRDKKPNQFEEILRLKKQDLPKKNFEFMNLFLKFKTKKPENRSCE